MVCKTAFFIIELDNIFAGVDDNVTAAYEMYDENAGFSVNLRSLAAAL